MPLTRIVAAAPDPITGKSVASEAGELLGAVEGDPEIPAVAACAPGEGARARLRGAEGGQVCRLPERDAVTSAVVRDQDALPVEGARDREVQPVSGQNPQHGAGGRAHDRDV